MIPREHLPLTLVTVALLGFLFLLFREVNAIKAAVAQLSVTTALQEKRRQREDIDDESDDEPEDDANTVISAKVAEPVSKPVAKPPAPTVNSSLKKSSA